MIITEEIFTLFPFDREEDFLSALLHTPPGFCGVENNMLFRGQADMSLPLLPTAFRKDKNKKEWLKELDNLECRGKFQKAKDMTKNQKMPFYELMAIAMFYKYANEQGLSLPPVRQDVHNRLLKKTNDIVREPRSGEFLGNEILPIMALAQHYGFPTRLLDWSSDPLVAAYFAAHDGLKAFKENKHKKDQKIGVWRTSTQYINRTWFLSVSEFISVIDVPYASNPNLEAQKGRFTIVIARAGNRQFYPLTEECHKPLNELYRDMCIEGEKQGRIKDMKLPDDFESSKVFAKYTLPVDRAPHLLNKLYKLGYTASHLFPGYAGCIKTVDELLEIRKYVDL